MFKTPLHFVCVGPQRTASSWLHEYLKPHPGVSLPTHVKETMFFNDRFESGAKWYDAHFLGNEEGKIRGEIAPTYFNSELAIQRLAAFDQLRVIIIVRNPIERTYSLFRHHRSKGRVPDDYMAAVRKMPEIESSGRYAEHCPKWEAAFGRKQCLYILQQDIQNEPQLVFDQLCRFLKLELITLPPDAVKPFGAATHPNSALIARHSARFSTMMRSRGLNGPIEFAKKLGLRSLIFGKPSGDEAIPASVARHLLSFHESDITYLESRLDRSFDAWRQVT